MKMKKLPVGISDFKDMVTGNYYPIRLAEGDE
jgi:hypothetical protein